MVRNPRTYTIASTRLKGGGVHAQRRGTRLVDDTRQNGFYLSRCQIH